MNYIPNFTYIDYSLNMQFPIDQQYNFGTFPNYVYENSQFQQHFSYLQQSNCILLKKNL